MQKIVKSSTNGTSQKKACLMAEYNVQVFSNGRVDWGELKNYMRPPQVNRKKMFSRLMGSGEEN